MAGTSFVDRWDTDQQGATWDSGLQWDVNVGPNPGDPAPYLDIITSEHRDKPKFMAMVTALAQVFADIRETVRTIPLTFDLDVAVGAQLDIVGQWVGVSRNIRTPLPNVYFSFGIEGQGFSEAAWRGPEDPVSGLVVLFDSAYRTLLRSRIANNQWNGTIPDAYRVWDTLFAGTGISILIIDLQDMHMLFALTGPVPDAVTLALLTGGYFDLKPAGVKIDAYVTPSVPDAPYFGFGVASDYLAGFGTGAWGTFTPPVEA